MLGNEADPDKEWPSLSVDIAEVQARLPGLIASLQDEPVVLEEDGAPVGVVASPDAFERMMEALENAEDLRLADEAWAEGGETIPWEQFQSELGL